ncbi:mucin-5AC-like [Lucilia sericata]|uniref:mucin-5AC-like n=1 Tax=Lucilia sericata TaxID=13632 RepID=UPI0018A8328E|nr:mucin-5AC-like [Lucilia sericata]
MVVCVGQNHANPNQPPLYQQSNMRNNLSNMQTTNFPPTIRTTGKSQSILINSNGGVAGASSAARHRQSEIDKSRSFDFDYCNYNAPGNNIKSQHSNNSLIGSQNLLNREAALRLEFDKSRSFDEDYREAVVTNNNLNANAMRYLQANENSDRNHVARIRRNSPVEGNGRNTRSPQSSGSSCNNLSVPRSTTSPQNYGTRLCDHEMTYDLMRKSLDRSPIMDFRRGDSVSGGDYDIPMSMLRNRETINSGGNSELNFMNSDNRQYEHMSSNSLKQQRSLRRTHSPNESHYSLERAHTAGSRDDITPNEPNDYRNEYNELYRRTRILFCFIFIIFCFYSDLFKSKTTNFPLNNTTSTTTNAKQQQQLLKDCSKQTCSYWPQCGACQNLQQQQPNYEYLKSLPLKRQTAQNFQHIEEEMKTKGLTSSSTTGSSSNSNSSCTNDDINNGKSLTQLNANISTVKININTNSTTQQNQTEDCPTTTLTRLPKSTTQWTLLCKNALASNTATNTSIVEPNINTAAAFTNTVVNVKSSPLMTTKLTETGKTVTATTTTTTNATQIPLSTSTTSLALSLTSSTSNNNKMTTFHQQPRVIPLAATSLVFLGDFEMPITRDRTDCNDIYETTPTKPITTTSLSTAVATTSYNIDNNFAIYEAKIQDNLKRICATTTTNEKQTRKYQTNKFKEKNNNNKLMMRKIKEIEADDCNGSTSSSSSSCNESSITSSCGSSNDNNCSNTTTTPTTTVNQSVVSTRKRKNVRMKAAKLQRYSRRPRMSLPNIWLNVAVEQEKRNEDVPKSKQQR